MVNPARMAEEALRDILAVDDKVAGILVQVPFFVNMDTVVNDTITLFELDALGCTIREIFVSFYLPSHGTATFTPTWNKTRPNDLVTFTQEAIPAIAAIATPAAARYYSYSLGELAHGLQGRFQIAQDNNAPAVTVDAYAVVQTVL